VVELQVPDAFVNGLLEWQREGTVSGSEDGQLAPWETGGEERPPHGRIAGL